MPEAWLCVHKSALMGCWTEVTVGSGSLLSPTPPGVRLRILREKRGSILLLPRDKSCRPLLAAESLGTARLCGPGVQLCGSALPPLPGP